MTSCTESAKVTRLAGSLAALASGANPSWPSIPVIFQQLSSLLSTYGTAPCSKSAGQVHTPSHLLTSCEALCVPATLGPRQQAACAPASHLQRCPQEEATSRLLHQQAWLPSQRTGQPRAATSIRWIAGSLHGGASGLHGCRSYAHRSGPKQKPELQHLKEVRYYTSFHE